jgi:threonine aldolase
MRTFRSDNNAGLCPEAMQALIEANDVSHEIGYGDDTYTARAVAAFKRIFGEDTAVFFVANGTAANTLAIAALTEPWQEIICHSHSHCSMDESTAPERFTHCRVSAIHTNDSKLTVADIENAVMHSRGDLHQPQPGVLTISSTTEFGTVYSPSETKALCDAAHAAGYRVHVDGARFANAVASLGCDPRDLTGHAGVDALSFGGTKNGLAFGEAVLFFPQGDRSVQKRAVVTFPFHRKSTGHLLSKHRFVSAPFAATLETGAWLRHAKHANTIAGMLADGLARFGLQPRFPVQANGVFVSLPPHVDAALQQCGHGYYPFGNPEWRLVRLMCSFDTTEDDVQRFVSDVEAATRSPAVLHSR